MRYIYNNILTTKPTVQNPKSIRYLSSTRYPNIPLSINDRYIYTMRGDRLDNLAYKFYGNSSLWWILSIANPELPNDSLYPTIGFQLRIPSNYKQIVSNFDLLNTNNI